MATETALAIASTIEPALFFQPGASRGALETLKKDVLEQASKLDISTKKGREDIASLAYAVARTGTGLDDAGKELTEDWRKKIDRVNEERRFVKAEIKALKEEVRQPLTDWENAEKDRVAKHEAALAELVQAGVYTEQNWQTLPIDAMKDRLAEIMASKIDWEEFLGRAKAAVVVTVGSIKSAIQKRETLESERAELERLRAEQAKRDQQERDERIAREAKEAAEASARLREEERAREAEAERQRIEAEKHEAETRAKEAEERLAAEKTRAVIHAKAMAEQAEKDKAAALEAEKIRTFEAAKAASEREKIAAAKAEADRKAAVEAERKRQEDEAKRAQEAAAKREADRNHSAKINREVRDAIVSHIFSDDAEEIAKELTVAIAKGLIPHVKINY